MRLSDTEAKIFYEAWWPLLWWVNEQRKVVPPLPRRAGAGSISPEHAAKVRDVLWAETSLLRTFVAENPARLEADLLRLVASWTNRLRGKYLVVKHYRDHTMLLDLGGHGGGFAVLGLFSSWAEIFPYRLPVLVDAVLLPFGDRIIHDGLVGLMPVTFGPGARRNILQDARRLRAERRVTRSLLPARCPSGPNPEP